MPRFICQQSAALAFATTATALTALHPLYHHLENGAIDSILQYLNAVALETMNRGK